MASRLTRTLLLISALALAGAAAARAVVVRAIEFQGLVGLPEETMRYYLGIEVGKELDEVALNRNLHALWDRHLLDDVRVEQEAVEGGVKLKVTVAERPVLRSIDYKGLKRISRTDINERISKDQIAVREGDPLSLGEIARLKNAIEEMYRDKGYRFAEASYSIESVSATERKLLFSIDEAERVRIGKIRFGGNDVYGDWRLRLAMKKTKQTNLISRLSKHDIYNPASMQEDLLKVRDLYRASGYKDVTVSDPVLSVLGKGAARRRLGVDIPIVEGRRWKLGEISIDGNQVFTDQMLLRRFKRPRGGWLRSKTVDDGVKDIDELYRNYGHIFARISTELREKEGNVADLIVKVSEGEQFRVGRMEFEGNTRTRDKVLRREMRVQEGTLLNMGALKNSIYKVGQLGYFKLNEEDPILFQNFDTEKKTVDLVVQGEESDRTELQVGGGYSELDGFFGQLSVRTQNFLGRGESVGVSFQSGKYRNEYDLTYSIPWLADRPQSLGVQLFNSDLDYSLFSDQRYIQKRKGAVVSYGRSFGLFNTFSVAFSRSDVHDSQSLLNVDNQIVQQTYDLVNTSIRPTYAYESRDSNFEPTRGLRFTTSLEWAGGLLGGDNYFLRPEVGFSWFHPMSYVPVKTVFAVNLESGWIKPFSGHTISPLELYFLGGETSVRGFRFRDLTVRDKNGKRLFDRDGFVVGGDKYLQVNLEYQFLLGGPFRLVTFFDAGNVFGTGQSIDINQLRYSAGAELRIFVPVFGAPLRFIYATNLDPLPDDRFEGFQFSIGATF
jgi:outer membrane protein insertion porin family